jgi:hypothetical protein
MDLENMRVQTEHSTQIWVHQHTGGECDRSDPDAIYFASLLERKVYSVLIKRNLQVVRQRKFIVKPATDTFPPIYYVCDFRIWSRETPSLGHLNVEAKGLYLDSFNIKVQLLERENPEAFYRFLIVHSGNDDTKSITAKKLRELNRTTTIAGLSAKLESLGY